MGNNWEFQHVGVEVRDLDKAIEHYQSLGFEVGPEPERITGSNSYKNFKMYGKTPDILIKTRIRFVQKDSLRFELLQPVEGYSVHNEFLDNKGEGASHVCFIVDDFDNEIAKLVEKGALPIFSGETQKGQKFAYMDARKIGGLIFEMVQRM